MQNNRQRSLRRVSRTVLGCLALGFLACGSTDNPQVPASAGAAGNVAGGAGPGSGGAAGTGGALGGSAGGGAGGAGGDSTAGGTGATAGAAGTVTGGSSGMGTADAALIEAGPAAGGAAGVRDAGLEAGRPLDASSEAGPPIVDLFNGTDLTGWTVNREVAAAQAPGIVLSTTEALQIFKVEGGMIHVYGDAPDQSTQQRHTMVTTRAYSKYRFWFEYKWGTKKFAPYTDLTRFPRDAGLLWHLHGDLTQVWPPSIEFQAKDGTSGDIFALYARCTSLATNNGTTFVEGGTAKLVDGSNGFVQHSRSVNAELQDWNAMEMEVGVSATGTSTAVYRVNGQVVNRVLSVMDRTGRPVTSGPLALQAEHAEVFYRNIRIQVLP